MIPAPPPTTTKTLHSHHTWRTKPERPKKHGPRDEAFPANTEGVMVSTFVNPGGPMIPASINPGGPMIPAPVNPGGPMIPAPVNPGGPMIPDSAPTRTLRSHHVWRPKPKKSEKPVTPTPLPFNPGGPMIPAKRQEGLPITPTPTSPTITVRPGLPSSDIEDCTSTIDITISRLATPPYWPQCSFDGTMTAYPATVTQSQEVDCGGCLNVEVSSSPEINCPAMIYNASTSVETPTTEWTTVCSRTTALSQMTPTPPVPTTDPPVAERDEDSCPTTLYVSALIQGGPVATVFQGTVSLTEKVPCGGCELVVVTEMGGEGPVIMPPTSTVTATGTTTVYQCQ